MIAYKIKDQVFYNKYNAFLYAAHNDTHTFPEFYFFNHCFDNINWEIEPTASWQSLLDRRARQIREKYDKIVFSFSGGTDSITIYNAFRRNNIFIDEIIIDYRDNSPAWPIENAQWIEKNHYDPCTVITIGERISATAQRPLFQSEDWILDERGSFNRYVPPDLEFAYLMYEQKFSGVKWCMVTGYEKPHLIYKNSQWYVTHLDKIFQPMIGCPNMIAFFISDDMPELHVKQCHLLKKYIVSNHPNVSDGWASYAQLGKKDNADYHVFAQACGRDAELSPGASFAQKLVNNTHKFNGTQLLLNNKFLELQGLDPVLHEDISRNSNRVKKYLKGWQNIQADQTLSEYMIRHTLVHSKDQPLESYDGLLGKFYKI